MRMKIYLIAALILLPTLSYSQEINPNEVLHTGEKYLNTLSVFKEPQIFPDLKTKGEVYRVFVAPTFYHPISIRVEKVGDKYFLVAKRLSGQGGYKWGKLKVVERRRLSEQEWRTLLDLLSQSSFWTLNSKDKEIEPNEKGEITVCLDGTVWFLEAVKDGKYHAVYRYCPDSKSFRAVGLYMIKLSRWSRDADMF